MVTIISYDKRKSEEGKEFFTLTVQGGVEVVLSKNGKNYITARKTSIPSTFDEETCKLIIGTKLPGQVIKFECEPYEYTNKETGEVFTATHTYEYMEEEELPNTGNNTEHVFNLYDGTNFPVQAQA